MKIAMFYLLLSLSPLLIADEPRRLPIVDNEELLLQFAGISKELSAKRNGLYKLDEKGYLELPDLNWRVFARGKTTSDLEKHIAGVYARAKVHPGLKVTIQRSA